VIYVTPEQQLVERERQHIRSHLGATSTYEPSWSEISAYRYCSDDFLKAYKNELDKLVVAVHQTLSEELIEFFFLTPDGKRLHSKFSWVQWMALANHQTLSNAFLDKHSQNFNQNGWSAICRNQQLSEEFMYKYKDKLIWEHIAFYQLFSPGFYAKNHRKIDIKILLSRKDLPVDLVNKIIKIHQLQSIFTSNTNENSL
jgi:hypothetical protein